MRDSRKLVQDIEKNRKHLQQNSGEGAIALEEMFEKKMKKDKIAMEKKRYHYDQYGKKVSHIDILLFNQFSLPELCKLKLDFLAFLTMRKDLLSQTMNQLTKIELIRFES